MIYNKLYYEIIIWIFVKLIIYNKTYIGNQYFRSRRNFPFYYFFFHDFACHPNCHANLLCIYLIIVLFRRSEYNKEYIPNYIFLLYHSMVNYTIIRFPHFNMPQICFIINIIKINFRPTTKMVTSHFVIDN